MARLANGAANTAVVLRIFSTRGSRRSRQRAKMRDGETILADMPSEANPSRSVSAKLETPPTSWPPVIRILDGYSRLIIFFHECLLRAPGITNGPEVAVRRGFLGCGQWSEGPKRRLANRIHRRESRAGVVR